MSVSFLTDTDVNKRSGNLLVALQTSTPLVGFATFRLISDIPSMSFSAAYAAAHPGVIGIGGTWNPGNAGDNATLSAGNTIVEFTDDIVGSAVGTVSYDPFAAPPACWEVEVVNAGAQQLGCAGEFLGDLFFYTKNAYAGGRFIFGVNISFYQINGVIYANQIAGPPLENGDVLGMVVYDPQQIDFFLNGTYVDTEQWGGSSAIPMCSFGAPP